MRAPLAPVKVKKKPNHERWVISYADLLTLLLALFVVLFASSTQDKRKLMEEAESLVQAFHGRPVPVQATPNQAGRKLLQHQPSPVPRPVQNPAPQEPHLSRALSHQLEAEVLQLQKLQESLSALLKPLTSKNLVSIASQPLTLTIRLNASVLFPTGQATLMPEAATLLSSIAGSLVKLPASFNIVIQGFTDDQPIATAQFPSNWSLSVERSVSVVRLFQTQGVNGAQLSAQGFGEFLPIAGNGTAAGRSQNRRVEIVIHAPEPNAS